MKEMSNMTDCTCQMYLYIVINMILIIANAPHYSVFNCENSWQSVTLSQFANLDLIHNGPSDIDVLLVLADVEQKLY